MVVARSSSPRSFAPAAIVLLLVGLFAGAIGLGQWVGFPLTDLPNLFNGGKVTGPQDRGTPIRLTIDSIDVRAKIIQVGKASDGSIATPDQDPSRSVGWYDLGPSPGELGTAVLVGHVDTHDSPAVFARLNELTAGATIEVRRADWKTVTFAVDSVERYPKTSFPANKVFKGGDAPRLALVTCGGPWVGGSVGYADNIIIMATQS